MQSHSLSIFDTQVDVSLSQMILQEKNGYKIKYSTVDTPVVREWMELRYLALFPSYPESIDTALCTMFFTAKILKQKLVGGEWEKPREVKTEKIEFDLNEGQIVKFLILSETTGFPFPTHYANVMLYWASFQPTLLGEPNPIYVPVDYLVERTPIEAYSQTNQAQQPMVAYVSQVVGSAVDLSIGEFTVKVPNSTGQVEYEINGQGYLSLDSDTLTISGLGAGNYQVRLRDAVGQYHFSIDIANA